MTRLSNQHFQLQANHGMQAHVQKKLLKPNDLTTLCVVHCTYAQDPNPQAPTQARSTKHQIPSNPPGPWSLQADDEQSL